MSGSGDYIDTIHKRALEMTGHTEDIGEAFDQWERERKAIVELFASNEEQDKLLTRLRKNWESIRRAIWGRGPISTALPVSAESSNAIYEAAKKLEIWSDDVLVIGNQVQQTKEEIKQLSFWEKIK